MAETNQRKRLHLRASIQASHHLSMIEATCINAQAGEQSYPGSMAEFHSRVDPVLVLDLVRIAKSAFAEEERQELGLLLDEMTRYIKLVSDEKGVAKSIDRDALILRARQLRSAIGI